MFPYLALISVPGVLAASGARRVGVLLLVVALLYWLFIGFRFHVGMDWNNYIFIYEARKEESLWSLMFDREPGFGLLTWIAAQTGGGILLINAVSGLIFCWGFFSVARRCHEPWLALVVATPLLVVAFSMSAVRQAIACGIIFYLVASWNGRTTGGRIAIVLAAMTFHFSAVFMLVFVAMGSRARLSMKFVTSVLVVMVMIAAIIVSPESIEAYSELYVSGDRKLTAPGAIAQVGALAVAAGIYLINQKSWQRVCGDSFINRQLAWAALLLLPAILISSVGSYRFALYLWPMGMYVYSSMPKLVIQPTGRTLLRLLIVVGSAAVLIGWLLLANNSIAWFPYENWLQQPDEAPLIRRGLDRQ